ncbi:uncharacterized protein LOC101863003 [Aplysia californica]|uniref:Uncharacterized protein LOC101863003 n=1 Tax=Aplysia californica TaxID=6500 RepID=A0ABM0ZV01_APLCA|nr:uncharacterized protein LOC101863003 [Aplysia californica]
MEKWCVHYVCGLLVLVQCFLTAVTYYTPVCESPRLCENNNRVCVTCTADGIPSGNRRYYYCSLYSYISPHVQVSPVTANVSYNRVGGYSCTARVLVRNLGPGTHYFKMYLYLSGNTGVLSALTTSISLPVTYTPVCDPPRLCGNNNNRVCVTCTADGIPSGVRGTYFCALYTTRSRSHHPQQIQVSDVTDGVNNNRRAGYSCTASVLVTRLGPGTHYFQMHLYQTGHTGVFSAFSSPISLYGRLAVSVDVSPNPVNICPGTSHDVTVVCSVKFEDTYNEPVFQLYWGGQLKQSTRGTLETNQYSSESYYTLVSKYTVDVNQAGSINFRCEAYNSVHTSEKASSKTITVQVNAPPSTPPKLTISGGVYSGLKGYSISLTPGQTYSASCDVSRGQPPVSSVTLTCPGVSQKTVSGTSVSLSNIPVVKWADQEKCVCAAQHVSQCYNLRTEVTIRVLFPPETVTFERTDRGNISPVDICPDSQPEIPLQCSATSNPQPQFTILVNEQTYSGPLQGQVVKSRTNTYVYSYDFVPEAGGTYNITCTAKGDKTALVESDQLTIFVREPPQTEPKITITSIGPSGNVSKNAEVIYKSIATNATCLVDGGYPPVTSQDILLTCGNLSGSEQITLPPGHSTDGEIACSCSASHITGCYSRSAHTRFNVSALPLSPEASTDNSDVTVVASVGVAVVVVVVIVVVVIVLVFRRRTRSASIGEDWVWVVISRRHLF